MDRRSTWTRAAVRASAFVALLWAIEVVDAVVVHRLDHDGVQPREGEGLLGIVFAPVLPGGWAHVSANTVPTLVLVFGWLAYLMVRGFFTGRAREIALGLLLVVVSGGVLVGVLPGQPGISWQGHLFGALGGGVAAYAERHRRSTYEFSLALELPWCDGARRVRVSTPPRMLA